MKKRTLLAYLLIFSLFFSFEITIINCREDWLHENWTYRKNHIIGASYGAGEGYQIRINVSYGDGEDFGEVVYLDGLCNSDFGDIRFTGEDGISELWFWREEKINNNYAIFWVKIEENLNTHETSIFIYYGNTLATYPDETKQGYNTFPFLFDNFESGNYLNYERYANNPILTSTSGDWDYGFLVKPNVIYHNGLYRMYYYGAIHDANQYHREIGLATSVDGYNFTKHSDNPIFSPEPESWDSHSVMDMSVIYHNNQYWMYYTAYDFYTYAIGLARSTDGINFERITNGIDETSKVLEKGAVGEWDYDLVSLCSVIYHQSQFWLYYWARPDDNDTSHFEIGLALSNDGVNFDRITDGISGTSKVLAVGSPVAWDARHVFRASVFYYDNQFKMYYIGNYPYPSLQKEIGYAYSSDGKSWSKIGDNPLMKIGSDNWENDYLPAVSFVFQEGDETKKGLVYYQGAYTQGSFPTNEIGVFMQEIKDDFIHYEAWRDIKATPVINVTDSPIYKGEYAFDVTSNWFGNSEFIAKGHTLTDSFALNLKVWFDQNNEDHFINLGNAYTDARMLNVFRARDNGYLQYYNGSAWLNFSGDITYQQDVWTTLEIRVRIPEQEFEVIWNGSSIDSGLWKSTFTDDNSTYLMLGAGYDANIYTDEVFIRKYVYPEPHHLGWEIYDETETWFNICLFGVCVVGLIGSPVISDILTKEKIEHIFAWFCMWLFFGCLFLVWIYMV